MLTRVLVVDEDHAVCEMIGSALNALGMEALLLYDTAEAAARLRSEKFDCVFLNVRTTPADGIELARQMRHSGFNQKTPIIMITEDTNRSLLGRGFQAGANFFLYKPIDRKRLLRVIRAVEGTIEQERRRYRRVAVSRKVRVWSEQGNLEGKTMNLSLNGLFVQAPGAFPAGSRVQVALQLGPGSELLNASGRVARVLGDNGMAIHLDSLSAAESERLQEFLLPLILGRREVEV